MELPQVSAPRCMHLQSKAMAVHGALCAASSGREASPGFLASAVFIGANAADQRDEIVRRLEACLL